MEYGLHTIKYTKRRCQKKRRLFFYSFFLCQLWWLPVSLQTAPPSHSVVAGRAHSRVLRRRVLGAPRVLLRLLLLMVLQHRQRLVDLVHQRPLVRQQHQQFGVVHLQKHSGNLTRQSGLHHLDLGEQPLSDQPLLLRRLRLLQHLRRQRVHLQHRRRRLPARARAQLRHRVLSGRHRRLVRLRGHGTNHLLRRSQPRRQGSRLRARVHRRALRTRRHTLRRLALLVLPHRLALPVHRPLLNARHLARLHLCRLGTRQLLLHTQLLCRQRLLLRGHHGRVLHRRILLQRGGTLLRRQLLRRHLLRQHRLLLLTLQLRVGKLSHGHLLGVGLGKLLLHRHPASHLRIAPIAGRVLPLSLGRSVLLLLLSPAIRSVLSPSTSSSTAPRGSALVHPSADTLTAQLLHDKRLTERLGPVPGYVQRLSVMESVGHLVDGASGGLLLLKGNESKAPALSARLLH